MKHLMTKVVIVVAAVALTACGQGMSTSQGSLSKGSLGVGTGSGGGTGTGGGSGATGPSIDYEGIQQQALKDAADAELAAEQAVAEAEKALNKISLGSGGVSFGDSGSMDQQLIVDKLVKKILDKVVEKLQLIPGKFDTIRAKLADAMSKLDPNNPLHQRGIDALMLAMQKVDMVEAKYKDLLVMVADKVDFVSGKLDMLAGAVPFPASLLVQFELSSVKVVLRDFQNQLRNL